MEGYSNTDDLLIVKGCTKCHFLTFDASFERFFKRCVCLCTTVVCTFITIHTLEVKAIYHVTISPYHQVTYKRFSIKINGANLKLICFFFLL